MGGIPKPPKGAERPRLELKVLTATEAKDLLPKFEASLATVFKWADKAISMTNKDMADAWIWASIDKSEREIIATHLIELGQKSKVVAEAVRKVTAMHRLMQIGLITGPRFYMTAQHYMEHGGFAFPKWGEKKKQQQAAATVLNPVAASPVAHEEAAR